MVSRYLLRRLYSTFAGGWPGFGLVVMRLVIGSVLLAPMGRTQWIDLPLPMTFTSASLAVSGLFLAMGLWTPVAGAIVAVIEISQILSVAEHPVVGLLVATMAAALAMLGPGRWSVDAHLFGWKRIDAPVHKKSVVG